MQIRTLSINVLIVSALSGALMAQDFALQFRTQAKQSGSEKFMRQTQDVDWKASETAVIVCDVWDAHHCFNAVQRMNEFLPRMNEFIQKARVRGATIIHAPSDCMETYAQHPSRQRAIHTPTASKPPAEIENWCSKIASEEVGVYPIDQSDGGEDDNPAEHQAWAEKLASQGRNPKMPWKAQSDQIKIDSNRDFISDRGDEVWNILEANGIKNVMLLGVHTNMCVLGRPFGLRQMVRNGKQACLVRDLTDCMYNPARWPYVDHFTGNDLVVSHIERYVCPTMTSDQILGDKAFRFANDSRETIDVMELSAKSRPASSIEWTLVTLPSKTFNAARPAGCDKLWIRCALRIDPRLVATNALQISLTGTHAKLEAWIDGHRLTMDEPIPKEFYSTSEVNWLVIQMDSSTASIPNLPAPKLISGSETYDLSGRWEARWDDQNRFDVPSLPAKFGASPDILIAPRFH